MVGRVFGVVMAFSFCFAPLHAVRFAQPPQGAGRFRVVWPPSLPLLPDRFATNLDMIFVTDSIRWLSDTGVSSHGKLPVNSGEMGENACVATAAGTSGSRVIWSNPSVTSRARSGAGAALDGPVGTVRVDVERTGSSLDHFARDHHFFDAFQTRK